MVEEFNEQSVGQFTGSRDERGIEAASIGADPAYNEEFARNKAELELIFFSDEDDHSQMTVDELLQAADDAVYWVKAHGKDGIQLAGYGSLMNGRAHAMPSSIRKDSGA